MMTIRPAFNSRPNFFLFLLFLLLLSPVPKATPRRPDSLGSWQGTTRHAEVWLQTRTVQASRIHIITCADSWYCFRQFITNHINHRWHFLRVSAE